MRQIVLDTETTGLKPADGHKVIEIGAVEMIDRVVTGKTFHVYLNPDRDIPEETIAIHGITNEQVKDCKRFYEIADEFGEFINGAELLIHNAEFDVKFLENEFMLANKGSLYDYTKNITCTLKLAKSIFPKQKSNLNMLCTRLEIDISKRVHHGALLDSELLSEAYLKMTANIKILDAGKDVELIGWVRPPIKRFNSEHLHLKTVSANAEDSLRHEECLSELKEVSKKDPVWNNRVKMTP